MIIPVATDIMIALSIRQRMVVGQESDDLRQENLNIPVPRGSLGAFVVTFEGGRSFNRSH